MHQALCNALDPRGERFAAVSVFSTLVQRKCVDFYQRLHQNVRSFRFILRAVVGPAAMHAHEERVGEHIYKVLAGYEICTQECIMP